MEPLLIPDIVLQICGYLDDYSKIQLISANKWHRTLIRRITINTRVYYSHAANLQYREIFANLFIDKWRYLKDDWSKLNNFKRLYKLGLKDDFDRCISLPKTLKVMIFGREFNQPVNLPEGLQKVRFGHKFNQSVKLPEGIQIVEFGYWFDQYVVLPQSTRRASFGEQFCSKLELPNGLEELRFNRSYGRLLNFPNSLKILVVGHGYPHYIPAHIEVVRI